MRRLHDIKIKTSTNMAAEEENKKLLALMVLLMNEDECKKKKVDDEDFLNIIPAIVQEAIKRNQANRITGYFESIIPMYSGIEFKSHFRMRRESVEILCGRLSVFPSLQNTQSGGRLMVEVGKQICLF